MEIILFGNEKDDKIARDILPSLVKDFKVLYCKKNNIKATKNPEVFIYDVDGKIELENKVDLIIVKEKANINNLKGIDKNIPMIFWSVKNRQRDLILKYGFSAVSCGLSQKDTLTFSSVEQDSSVISLQRDLFFHSPMDIPVIHPKKISKYSILVLAAIKLYIDKSDEINLLINKPKITINKRNIIGNNINANAL